MTPAFIVIFLLAHCNTYSGIKVSRKVVYKDNNRISVLSENKRLESFLSGYKPLTPDRKSYPVNNNELNRVYNNRYFICRHSFTPLDLINNRAVKYAMKGMFREAEILFKEVLKENGVYQPALNNLGVVYELSCDHSMAFDMYLKAYEADSGNEYVRRNFLLLCDNCSGGLFDQCMSIHFSR